MWTNQGFEPEIKSLEIPTLAVCTMHDYELYRKDSIDNLIGVYFNKHHKTLRALFHERISAYIY